MDDVDDLLKDEKPKVEPETPKDEGGEAKVFEVNGRKYNQAEMDKMAADFQASEKERGRLAHENDTLKKTVPDKPADKPATTEIPEAEKQAAKKALGYVTAEDLDVRDYVKEATKEVIRLSTEYGLKSDDLFKEMVDLNRKVPVEKLELLLKLTHPEEYEKKRAAGIAADKPATPYTERTVKPGVEIPPSEALSFRKENTVKKAMEVIGAKE